MTPSGFFLAQLWLVPVFPALAAALLLSCGRYLPKSLVSFVATGTVALSFVFSGGVAFELLGSLPAQRFYQQILFAWMAPGLTPFNGTLANITVDWGYLLDPLSCLMLLLATGIGLLTRIYSVGSMRRDVDYHHYAGVMTLSIASMITLILANNLLLLFAAWQVLALCAYLLIGFHYKKSSATNAALKALLFNLIADAGLLLAIFLTATTFGTVRFTSHGLPEPEGFQGIQQVLTVLLNQHLLWFGAPAVTAIALLLFVGALGKSAQLPLQVWLPDATEAPISATALLHSAGMATAGIYLVVRMSAVFQLAPLAMTLMAVLGTFTALYAAMLAVVQTDIKKILAYSTISQFGLIFLALGVGAFSIGIFHLMTHAFFKSLLFLGAGSLIYALSGEQDIRKMGGMSNAIPGTARPFLIATLAISALPPLAGFFSQNEILGRAFHRSSGLDGYIWLWLVGVITAAITSFYSFRLLFLAFYGRSRVSPELEVRIQQPPASMTAPMMILTFLCIISGWLALPMLWGERNTLSLFLAPVFGAHELDTVLDKLSGPEIFKEYALMAAPLIASLFGILLANRIYLVKPKLRETIAAKWPRTYNLLTRNFYVNEVYEAFFVNRLRDLSVALEFIDVKVIDGLVTGGIGRIARSLSRVSGWLDKWILGSAVRLPAYLLYRLSHPFRLLQSGIFSTYAMWMLFGLALLLGYYGHHMQIWVSALH